MMVRGPGRKVVLPCAAGGFAGAVRVGADLAAGAAARDCSRNRSRSDVTVWLMWRAQAAWSQALKLA
jgi:hypothetical protein